MHIFGHASLGGVKTQSFDEWQATATCMTVGGGRGALQSTHGDYPIAALRGVKTQQANSLHGENIPEKQAMVVHGKNVQSIQTELDCRTCWWDWRRGGNGTHYSCVKLGGKRITVRD